MPVIKVWCLPPVTEARLKRLHKDIVAAVVSVKELGLKNESDMTCLFPSDMMSYGLDEEIIVEVTGLFEKTQRTETVRQQLAMLLTLAVHDSFPKAVVECFVYPFRRNQGFCTIRP